LKVNLKIEWIFRYFNIRRIKRNEVAKLSMKINIEKLFIGLVIGIALPAIFSLLALTIWFYVDTSENRAPLFLFVGFITGCLIDLKYLKSWIKRRYELPLWFAVGIYVLYNILVYGMFMGFPVFNALLGILAGYYYGKKISYHNIPVELQSKIIKHVLLITGLIMVIICISSALIALAGEGVGKDLQNMFGLGFEVSRQMILGIAITGGSLLILIQILTTRIIMKRIINK
jgi:hypothetical protein